ncbi:MAG: glycosyltransferase [Sphingomonadaceae bacterium]
MIFLSVGTQEPFDRLVRAVDSWAAAAPVPVFGQLGALGPESYRPAHMQWAEFIPADQYEARLQACRVMVAHAGMGSIISALTHMKPLLILPRRASLGEHRNEHQLATAEKFRARPGIHVADDEAAIGPLLDRLLETGDGATEALAAEASPDLIAALRRFIQG